MKQFFKSWAWPIVAGLLFGLLVASQQGLLPHQQPPPSQPGYADAVALAGPAVVNIYTSKTTRKQLHPLLEDPFFRHFFHRDQLQKEQIERSLGSGVIVSQDGYILTNLHVIKDADEILILLSDGRDALAHVVGYDTDTDLAVLRIDLPMLTAIPIGNPQQSRVGDIVLAIGNPYGFQQTVTQGIISAFGRHGLQINTYEDFIQTDAAINPGNSGGALINNQGQLLGINSAIWSQSGGYQGIGLAIPSDIALKVLTDIVQYGYVVRGWLGIEVRQLSPQYAQSLGLQHQGVIVTGTYPGGPADSAGILPSDIITTINDQTIRDGYMGMRQVANIAPGNSISVELLRDGQLLTTQVMVGTRPANGKSP